MAECGFVSKFLFALSVPKCLSCGCRLLESESALCQVCGKKYYEIKDRSCSVCLKPLNQCSCTNDYLSRHFVRGLAKVYRYRHDGDFSVANSIVYRLKRKNRTDALDFASEEVAAAIKASLPGISENTIITYVPNRKTAIIKQGFDHAKLLAIEVSKKLGVEFMPLLVSLSKKAQKEMHGEERISNAMFDLISDEDLSDKIVIIVDDIVTTGASMGNSATLIRALRPKAIYGACLGIAYRDDYRANRKH